MEGVPAMARPSPSARACSTGSARTSRRRAPSGGSGRRPRAGRRAGRPGWTAAATSTLRFAASRAGSDGALGSAYHGRTGAVESWAGSAGLAWVPALVEGAAVLGEPDWLDVARAAGAHYAAFVDRAFLHGAP